MDKKNLAKVLSLTLASTLLCSSLLPVESFSKTLVGGSTQYKTNIPLTIGSSRTLALGFYEWSGLELYKKLGNQTFWSYLPYTNRIFLSFNGQQINSLLADPNEANLLNQFIYNAAQRGIKVELLLGDPSWALDGYRDSLIKIISELSRFHFAGIQLDIEKSQLPLNEQNLWDTGIVKTIKAVRSYSRNIPIGLSLNYQVASTSLLNNLYKAGLNEAVIMIYSINANRIEQVVTPIIKSNPRLLFSVAQSIEPTTVLPASETYSSVGETTAVTDWSNLYQYFSKFPNFKNIIVQSFEYFLQAKN